MAKVVKSQNARKDSSQIKGVARAHRKKLREEAEARQTQRNKRSVEEQLALIESRPGNSRKERERLEAHTS